MLCTKQSDERSLVGRWFALIAIGILAGAASQTAQAQATGQQRFPTAVAACAALVGAVDRQDRTALAAILGPSGNDILTGGNDIEDRENQRQFVAKYREMHRLVREANGTTTLFVGAENWPLPIVLKHRGKNWYFDPVASRAEMLYRRVGANELATIATTRELVAAQKEYFTTKHDGVNQYAARFLSSRDERDGLYWKGSGNEPESPIGPWLTLANPDDLSHAATTPQPFHGYYFRVLKAQGRHASGGMKRYLVDGKMTGGFAFVAYPAEYRSSAVMTFIVNQDGVVFQRDLGPRTAMRARAMTLYDPTASWKEVR